MAAINPTIELAKIRGKIDDAQQKVAFLETLLQQSILGGTLNITVGDLIEDIQDIDESASDGDVIGAAFERGLLEEANEDDIVEQDIIRQALAVQRALLGELRVEEQGWNQEVNQEKERRKDLNEFAKG